MPPDEIPTQPADELEFVHIALDITGPTDLGGVLARYVDWENVDMFAERGGAAFRVDTPVLLVPSLYEVLDRLYEDEGHDFGDLGTIRSPHVLAIRFANDVVVLFHQAGRDVDPVGVQTQNDYFPCFPLAGHQIRDVLHVAHRDHEGTASAAHLLRAIEYYIENDAFLQE